LKSLPKPVAKPWAVEPMEFVNAYRANRLGLMAGAADASAIGRAIKAFMAKHADGFEGKMEDLLVKLGTYRRGAGDRDWPKDATRLAGFIRRVVRRSTPQASKSEPASIFAR